MNAVSPCNRTLRGVATSAAAYLLRRTRAYAALSAVLILGACSTAELEVRSATSHAGAAPGTANQHLEAATNHFQAARYGLALEQFRLALRSGPASRVALNGMAATYDMLGRHEVAQGFYRRALVQFPNDPRTLNNLGYSFLVQKQFERAERYLSLALELAREPEHSSLIERNLGLAKYLGERGKQPAPSAAEERSADRSTTGASLVGASSQVYRLMTLNRRERPADAFPSPRDRNRPLSVEVSNGAGRRGMAARLARHVSRSGTPVDRITNADTFSHRRSVIYYRRGFRSHAQAIAALMPVEIDLRLKDDQASDIRVRLGGDALNFDRTLIVAERRDNVAAATREIMENEDVL